MKKDDAYKRAEQMIEHARREMAVEIDLRHMNLTSVPESLGSLVQLQRLNLSGNQLTAVPEALYTLTQLSELYLNGNQLTAISDALGQLTQLRTLDLGVNRLSALPEMLGQLTMLQVLRLEHNQLTTMPESLDKLTQLQNLYISDNQLTLVPEAIGNLTHLKTLLLYGNQLTSLPEALGQLTQLKVLVLFGNQLTVLPEALCQLRQLQKLYLYYNKLTSVPEMLGELKQLQMLRLDWNQLMSMPESLGQLKQLQTLDLHNNQLTEVPESLGKLTRLQALDLSNNQLASLPKSLRRLKNLQTLYLHNNPELNIPPEILGPVWQKAFHDKEQPGSPQTILEYYFRKKRPLNEAKLILVGFGRVGKTSLVKRLVENAFDKNEEETDGINITQWPVSLTDSADKVLLHVWDFGGQEIMHSTHQFFLSHRSLYLLVLNGRQGHEDSDAEYWLNLIRSFGSDSRVIVVLNKQREHPFDLNREHLLSKFSGMVQCFIKTECEDTAEGIEELRQTILRETGRLSGLHDGFPEVWFTIKDELAGMKENYLTFEQYRETCARLGEETQLDQDRLAGYLHQLGVALNYKDDPRLRDMHILNPRWVTEGIYTILNAKELEERKGELRIDHLGQILDPKNYPRERHLFLMNLMRKFHLCFEFPDNAGHYLVPDLADKNQPKMAAEFDPQECLNFYYKYPVLHEDVLPSFITRTYILSEKHPRWRTGVILEFEGCCALVKGDLTERMVRISVIGTSPDARRRLLAVIRTSFEEIHRNFDFDPEAIVPVPGHPEVAIPYTKLLVYEKKTCRTIHEVVGDDVMELNVLDLLNGVDLAGERRLREPSRRTEARGLKLFYSYSHRDEGVREELETHLKILQRQGLIDDWHDRRIVGGQELENEIDKHLKEADVILLLVSADFLASDYCYNIEMKCAMERHKAGEAKVIPIILRESNWHGAPFGKLQALPKDGKPVVAHERKDIAWTEISKAIEEIARGLT